MKFNSNGGSGTLSDQKLTYDKAANLSANSFSKTGYTFSGWNTKADGTGTAYANKASVKNLATSGSVTLYAQWQTNKLYVRYDTNGGTISDKSDYYVGSDNLVYVGETNKIYQQCWLYDTEKKHGLVNDSTLMLTREGYNFRGWGIAADGQTIYDPYDATLSVEQLFPDIKTKDGTITLYAQWEETNTIVTTITTTTTVSNIVTTTETITSTTTTVSSGKNNEILSFQDDYSFLNDGTGFNGKYNVSDFFNNLLSDKACNTEWDAILNRITGNTKWSGSCYGMSSVQVFAKSGLLNIKSIDPSASCLYDWKSPKNDSSVESIINYYHMMQYTNVFKKRLFRHDGGLKLA